MSIGISTNQSNENYTFRYISVSNEDHENAMKAFSTMLSDKRFYSLSEFVKNVFQSLYKDWSGADIDRVNDRGRRGNRLFTSEEFEILCREYWKIELENNSDRRYYMTKNFFVKLTLAGEEL